MSFAEELRRKFEQGNVPLKPIAPSGLTTEFAEVDPRPVEVRSSLVRLVVTKVFEVPVDLSLSATAVSVQEALKGNTIDTVDLYDIKQAVVDASFEASDVQIVAVIPDPESGYDPNAGLSQDQAEWDEEYGSTHDPITGKVLPGITVTGDEISEDDDHGCGDDLWDTDDGDDDDDYYGSYNDEPEDSYSW